MRKNYGKYLNWNSWSISIWAEANRNRIDQVLLTPPPPKQNSPSNQMKDWLPTNDSPVTGGLFYPLVVLESSSHLLPSFSDHLAYMKVVDLKCQNFHHSFQKGQNFWSGSKAKKYVLFYYWNRGLTILFDSVRMGRNTLNCVKISSLAYSSQNFHHQCHWTCTSTKG